MIEHRKVRLMVGGEKPELPAKFANR